MSTSEMKQKGHAKKGKRRAASTIFAAVLLLCAAAVLTALKIIRINPYFAAQYPVWGVDVSHYQGEIDWEQFKRQGVQFAYIKATEGSGFVDDRYASNRESAGAAEIYVGAYHFFSFDSPASSQAEHFISTVGDLDGALPPQWTLSIMGINRTILPQRNRWFPNCGNCFMPWKKNMA